MNSRQEINRQILNTLRDLNERHGDQRFLQLLSNFLVENDRVSFYEESAVTFSRLVKRIEELENGQES
jgi:hypothetical protein